MMLEQKLRAIAKDIAEPQKDYSFACVLGKPGIGYGVAYRFVMSRGLHGERRQIESEMIHSKDIRRIHGSIQCHIARTSR